MRARRRKKGGSGIGTIAFIVLAICAVVAYRRVDLNKQKNDLERKYEIDKAQVMEQEERSAALKNREAYVQTRKYIEEIAREKLGLVYEEDILFKREQE